MNTTSKKTFEKVSIKNLGVTLQKLNREGIRKTLLVFITNKKINYFILALLL